MFEQAFEFSLSSLLRTYSLDLYATRQYRQTYEAYVQVPGASRWPGCLKITASGGWLITSLIKVYHLLVLD